MDEYEQHEADKLMAERYDTPQRDSRIEEAYAAAVSVYHQTNDGYIMQLAEAVRLLADAARNVKPEPELFLYVWTYGEWQDNVMVVIAPNKETAEDMIRDIAEPWDYGGKFFRFPLTEARVLKAHRWEDAE